MEQVVNKGIRQISTKEGTHSLTAVPFVRGHRSMFPRTPRNTCVYTRHPTNVTAMCGVLTRLPAKLSKNGMRVKTSTDQRLKKNCGFKRPPKQTGKQQSKVHLLMCKLDSFTAFSHAIVNPLKNKKYQISKKQTTKQQDINQS